LYGSTHDRSRSQEVQTDTAREREDNPDTPHDWLAAQRRAWMSVWEITHVEPGRSVTVKDLLTDERRQVTEVRGSDILVPRDAVLCRVVDHAGASLFRGLHPRPLLPREADEVIRRMRTKARRKGTIPIERLREETLSRHFISCWEEAVDALDHRRMRPGSYPAEPARHRSPRQPDIEP